MYVPNICMYPLFVCTHYLYVPTVCMYPLFVCTRYLYVPTICMYPLFVCTHYLYVPTICMYPLFVCTRYLYVPAICMYPLFVCIFYLLFATYILLLAIISCWVIVWVCTCILHRDVFHRVLPYYRLLPGSQYRVVADMFVTHTHVLWRTLSAVL